MVAFLYMTLHKAAQQAGHELRREHKVVQSPSLVGPLGQRAIGPVRVTALVFVRIEMSVIVKQEEEEEEGKEEDEEEEEEEEEWAGGEEWQEEEDEEEDEGEEEEEEEEEWAGGGGG